MLRPSGVGVGALHAQLADEVVDVGLATELLNEQLVGAVDPLLQLLDPARRADHPPMVTEIAADLPADRRYREAEQVRVLGPVETVDRFDQAFVSDLPKVLGCHPATAVVHRDGLGHAAVDQHDLVQDGIPRIRRGVVQALEELRCSAHSRLSRVGR